MIEPSDTAKEIVKELRLRVSVMSGGEPNTVVRLYSIEYELEDVIDRALLRERNKQREADAYLVSMLGERMEMDDSDAMASQIRATKETE